MAISLNFDEAEGSFKMDEKTAKSIEKWEAEKKSLESVKRYIKKYQKLKEDKENDNKAEMNKIGEKVTAIFEDSKWMKLEWKEIKKSKKALEEGLAKVDKKISDRKKKIGDASGKQDDKGEKSFAKAGPKDKAVDEEAESGASLGDDKEDIPAEEERDWSGEIEKCETGSVYYHWIYGKMEVLAKDGDYIYMKLLDKKGCRHEWLAKNNAVVEIDGKEEEAKEFSLFSIGRWLFPDVDDIEIIDPDKAHRSFIKN
jgi:hypothetical protein